MPCVVLTKIFITLLPARLLQYKKRVSNLVFFCVNISVADPYNRLFNVKVPRITVCWVFFRANTTCSSRSARSCTGSWPPCSPGWCTSSTLRERDQPASPIRWVSELTSPSHSYETAPKAGGIRYLGKKEPAFRSSINHIQIDSRYFLKQNHS